MRQSLPPNLTCTGQPLETPNVLACGMAQGLHELGQAALLFPVQCMPNLPVDFTSEANLHVGWITLGGRPDRLPIPALGIKF